MDNSKTQVIPNNIPFVKLPTVGGSNVLWLSSGEYPNPDPSWSFSGYSFVVGEAAVFFQQHQGILTERAGASNPFAASVNVDAAKVFQGSGESDFPFGLSTLAFCESVARSSWLLWPAQLINGLICGLTLTD